MKRVSFQSSLENFQCQFWVYNVIGQRVPHDWSADTEASWPEATCPGHGVVMYLHAEDRRWALAPISEIGMHNRPRYVGSRPSSEFRTKVAILKIVHWRMGSQ